MITYLDVCDCGVFLLVIHTHLFDSDIAIAYILNMIKQIKKPDHLVTANWRIKSSQKKYIQKLAKEDGIQEGPYIRILLDEFITLDKSIKKEGLTG